MVLRFLGIDPGIAIVGFGFVDKIGSKVVPVQYGCIQTEAHTPEEERLLHVYEGMVQLIDKYKPDAVALEKLFSIGTLQQRCLSVRLEASWFSACGAEGFAYCRVYANADQAGRCWVR